MERIRPTRPLVAFRELCQLLLAEGIAPTPKVLAEYGYANPKTRNINDGHYSAAREEELIKAGWRRVLYRSVSEAARAYVPNFRWEPIKRKQDKIGTKKVGSLFRKGDTVYIYSTYVLEMLGDVSRGPKVITGYKEINWEEHGRTDLAKSHTALVVRVGKKEVLCWDDELILAIPAEEFPLKLTSYQRELPPELRGDNVPFKHLSLFEKRKRVPVYVRM